MTPLDEVRFRALRFIRLEEDKEVQKTSNPSSQYENPNRKAESSTPRSYKLKPYSKPDHHMVNSLEDEGEEKELPKITEYCFLWIFRYNSCYAGSWRQRKMTKEG